MFAGLQRPGTMRDSHPARAVCVYVYTIKRVEARLFWGVNRLSMSSPHHHTSVVLSLCDCGSKNLHKYAMDLARQSTLIVIQFSHISACHASCVV